MVSLRHRACASLEGTPIDIIFLVERLESLIAIGKKMPLTTNVVVNPRPTTSASSMGWRRRTKRSTSASSASTPRASGRRQAQDEAERIVARAQEQAAFLIDERGLTQSAEAQSRVIIGDAHRDADDIRKGADEYAVGVLVGLEADVTRTLESIRNGIDLLDGRRASLDGTGDGHTDGGERAMDETGEHSHSTR